MNVEKKWLAALIVIALTLCLVDLTDVFVWADEGETLLLGQMTLKHGAPRAFDEDYRLCVERGLTPHGLWTAQPWALFYFTAFWILLFGKNLFFLRLPFVLIGVATIPLLFSLTKKLGFSRRTAFLATTFVTFCVPLLLLFRQVRYYSLQVFLAVLLVWLYANARNLKKNFWWIFGLVSALFAHIMPPVFMAVVLTITAHAFFFDRRSGVRKQLIHSQCLMLVFFLPWFLYVAPSLWEFYSFRSSSTLGRNMGFGSWFLGGLLFLVVLVNFHFPAFLLLLVTKKNYQNVLSQPRTYQSIWLLISIVVAICFSMSFFFNSNLWFGYVAAAIPFVLILAACVMDVIFTRWRRLGMVLVIVFMFTNWLNLPRIPFYQFFVSDQDGKNQFVRRLQVLQVNLLHKRPSYLMFDFFGEVVGEYTGPVEEIIKLLREKSVPGDTFFTTNDFSTLHFFTGLKRVDSVPFREPPTWIFKRGKVSWGHFLCQNDGVENVDAYVENFLKTNDYEAIVLDAPNIYHENEPVVPYHLFQTSDLGDRVVVFKRRPE